jgi:uncharacterized protein
MSLNVNLQQLSNKDLHLQGEMDAIELDLDSVDELIQLAEPIKYDLEVQKLDQSILVQGQVRVTLRCACVRCLKPFLHTLEYDEWTCHVALEGEEQAVVVSDCVDLTPYLREAILLDFPQHPLCEAGCAGLSGPPQTKPGPKAESTSVWAELDKLNLDN